MAVDPQLAPAGLPPADARDARTDPTSPRPEELLGLVLLVDDEPLMLRALRRILRADGHRLALAEDAAAAEATLLDPELEVVLLDLVMHGISGLELLDRIKRD